ncbi:zinc ribbon domain-containing protein [bacterium]|nr:zinc ribbon domain-containing protein [bacterium]
MPVYEYQCKKCGHVFERIHGIGEHKKYRCPDCSSSSTQKIISQVGVIFKGSGFYATDNRKSSSVKSGNGSKVKTTSKESRTNKSKGDSSGSTDTSPVSEN